MEEFPKSSLNLKEVILVNSNFEKVNDFKLEKFTIKNFLGIDIEHNINLPEFSVSLKLKYDGKVNDVLVMTAFIVMVGNFVLEGEKPDFFDEFIKVNAPAIIYPFAREHLHYLTNKSGINGVNLPLFNFVSYSKKYFANKEPIQD
ncbi:MAG: protein-export chaperone SecB [Ignavibacteria bacterium]